MKLKKRTIFLVIICLIIGFAFAYKIFVYDKTSPSWTISESQDNSKRFISKDTLITDIKQKQKIITTEVSLKETITVDNSWGSLSIFKKIQTINFVGTGLYSVDLSNLNSKNIDISGNTITVTLPNPSVEMINTDPDKTTYEKTDNGLLRFGEIKLSTEDQEQLQRTVEEKMKEKMLEKQYYDTAISNSEKSMTTLIKSIVTNTNPSYTVKIKFS